MSNITYLIGAGASANKIPCLTDFTDKLNSALTFFETDKQNIIDYIEKKHHPHSAEIIKSNYDGFIINLQKIYSEAKEYSTVDTYAKFLYITDQYRKIGHLCLLISSGLLFFQKDGTDKRYDNFWASILDTSTPPQNVKIVSWNYDMQFEQSFLKFYKSDKITDAQVVLKVFPSENYSSLSDYRSEGMSLVKLNGGIVKYNATNLRFSSLVENCTDFYKSFGSLLFEYSDWITKSDSKRIINIGYAWDLVQNRDNNSSLDIAKHVTKNTEILTIIGYSFPFFNRKIDQELLNSMINLKKIYIQDLNPSNITSRLNGIINNHSNTKIEIVPLTDVQQFFVPYEF